MNRKMGLAVGALVAALVLGCDPECACKTPRTEALGAAAWQGSEWISVAEAPVRKAGVGKPKAGERAADGVSWFARKFENRKAVKSAKWMVSGLGVFEVYLNGERVGCQDALKPGFTHCGKTRVAFTYDVTALLKTGAGDVNFLAAEVSGGWWRDKITGFQGLRSAFRGVLELTYADGTVECVGTDRTNWTCGVAGPITHAAIFDGEEYDARVKPPYFGEGLTSKPMLNGEFKGTVVPTEGAEVCRRFDKALEPVGAYCWKGVTGASADAFGTVVKTKTFAAGDAMRIGEGETLVVDFGQNAAAVPFVRFRAERGTVITFTPCEMLNDGNGAKARRCDGPEGSAYRENYRDRGIGLRAVYTFAGEGTEIYLPRHSFFGYRYLSIAATDEVEIEALKSVPVTSVRKCMELGRLETGVADVNKLISNVYWGELSNYLSVPTDCPQRDERLGWTADTQVFAEAGAFNADTRRFFRKWMRDMRDSQHELGGFPSVAPRAQYGNEHMRLGWSDAGIIVPYQVWKQFGDRTIVDENWEAMLKCLKHVRETKYRFANLPETGKYQYADWLSYEKYEARSCSVFENGNKAAGKVIPEAVTYWDYLGACYWLWNEQMLAVMAKGTGRDAAPFETGAAEVKRYLKENFFDPKDGLIVSFLRDMQTPALFALKFGLVEGKAKERTIEGLRKNFAAHGDCLQTGFLGTSILMETLTENGMTDIAYTLLLQHKNPSWLYSVDQGATTIWERWNSYTKKDGFGPSDMNSFNHYAYGAVLAWMYKTMAGIAADPAAPGFKRIVMAPRPDRRVGHVTAEYKSAAGLIKSAWRYEGKKWIWDFTVPEGAVAAVTLPDGSAARDYAAGDHHVELTVREPRILGHRGTRGEYQENCAEALRLALKNGIDGFETDIRMTKDGRLVIMHDAKVERVSDGKGTVEELTFDEIRRFRLNNSSDLIPTLEEMISPLKGRDDVFIELEMKSSPITKAGRLDEYLEKSYATAKRILEPGTYAFTSFDEDYLKRMHELHPDARTGLIRAKPITAEFIVRAKELGCRQIAPLLKDSTKDLVDRAHAAGLAVTLWMVQNRADWAEAKALGADCTTSDYPILLRQAIDGRRKKVVAMDLDATLCQHRSPIPPENLKALDALMADYRCFMSGAGNAPRIYKQMGNYPIEIVGNYGMQESAIVDGKFEIVRAVTNTVDRTFFREKTDALRKKYGYTEYEGEPLEFHASGMVTFGLLGTKPSAERKVSFDPDRKKRRAMYKEVCEIFKDYSVYIGGSTSFDFAGKQYNKYDATLDWAKRHGYAPEDVVFIGDDFADGGGDSHVRIKGLDHIVINDYRKFASAVSVLLK